MNVTRSIVYGVVGPCKTESSQKPVPVHPLLADALSDWRKTMCLHQARRLGFCQQAPPRAEAILGTGDPAQISSTGCATTRNPEMHRLAHVSSHVFDAFEKRGYGIQSHAGTLAAFNSAINLGCVYPGSHASQTCSSGSRLGVGVSVRSACNATTVVIRRSCSVRESTGRVVEDERKGTQKGARKRALLGPRWFR
jgi:hypothetical protein